MPDRNVVIGYMFSRGIKWGVLVGAVSGGLLGLPIFIIGALFGIFIGGFVGLFVGMATGVLTGGITVLFFYPMKDVLSYRIALAIGAATFAALFTYIGSLYVSDRLPKGTIYFILPTVCAALFAIPVSQNLANWYINHKIADG